VSGQDYPLSAEDAARIADAAELDGATYAALSDAARDLVQGLLQAGHYSLVLPDEEE
jgi:50S ribosomal protein L16 3-hydroxylase